MVYEEKIVFPFCTSLVNKNLYSTVMEHRAQVHVLRICQNFPHKYIIVFTDSRNAATTLLNPQRVYANLELLRPMWSILEYYLSSEVLCVPRNNTDISQCDIIAHTDIVVPTDEFLHEFYERTHIFPRFIADQQNTFLSILGTSRY